MRSRSSFIIALSMLVLGPAVAIRVAIAEENALVPAPEANPGMPAIQTEPLETPNAPVPSSEANPGTPTNAPTSPTISASLATPRVNQEVPPIAPKPVASPQTPVAPPAQRPITREATGFHRFGGPAQASHYLQTGFAVLPGSGYRLIVPYKENQFCGDRSGRAGSRVCSQIVPLFTELQLSFGVSAGLDVLLDVRIGLGDEPVRPRHHAFFLSPGVRFWLDRTPSSKFFSTLQFVYDYLDFSGFDTRSSDYGVRNVNGFMYDLRRNLGIYAQVGETIAFIRWFHIALDFGLGIQLRLP